MTVTIDLPPELESEALQIGDLKDRLVLFVRQQVDLEHWRSQRFSKEVRQLVAESATLAETLTPEEASAGFLDLHERVTLAMKE